MRNEGAPSMENKQSLRSVFLSAEITGLHSKEEIQMDMPVQKMPLGMAGPNGADLLVKYGDVYYPAQENRYGEIRVVSKDVWSVDGRTWSTPERREQWIKEKNQGHQKEERHRDSEN